MSTLKSVELIGKSSTISIVHTELLWFTHEYEVDTLRMSNTFLRQTLCTVLIYMNLEKVAFERRSYRMVLRRHQH